MKFVEFLCGQRKLFASLWHSGSKGNNHCPVWMFYGMWEKAKRELLARDSVVTNKRDTEVL